MDEIRAFVGHSFAESDATIVDKFLSYLDTVAKLHPAFSWEHAEAAEAKQLSEKVMSLVADKNTFIGICTRNELAVREAALSKVRFQAGYRKTSEADLEWKTSDWIIQEIGLAKARNFEIILLIEEGVRRPGGLQGDVEYIPFTRDAPEKSFNKILEMIISLSPKKSAIETSSADATATIAKEQPGSSQPTNGAWSTSLPTWKRADYNHALFRALSIRDTDAASRIKVKHRVEYLVGLTGHALDGVVKRSKEGDAPTSLLALADNASKVLMILSDDRTEFRVMENPYNANPSFYSIRRSVAGIQPIPNRASNNPN